jgi:hypothetical protein
MGRGALAILAVASLAACGPSMADVRAAKNEAYKTEFANVWNAVVDAVHEDYPRIKVENAIQARVITDWHLVERVGGTDDMSSITTQTPDPTRPMVTNPADPTNTTRTGARFFRVAVFIDGGPHGPWVVSVDGEAAEYKPGMTLIVPYGHGKADEPPWVYVRIDKVYAKIHRRLKKYAVARAPQVEAPKPRIVDTTPWANLPDGAARVVADVNDVAAGDDPSALRKYMADDFTWSLGGSPSADQALTVWSADTSVIGHLRKTLSAGCGATSDGVACPADAVASGQWRAEFKEVKGRWMFTSFLQAE